MLRQGQRPGGLHGQRPRRPDLRADRAERRGQDHAAATARRPVPADRGPGHRERRHPAPGPGLPGRRRLPGPGHPAVPAAVSRGPHPRGRAPEPALGRGIGARAADLPEDPAGPGGGQAVRRSAGPGRAGPDPGQAAPAAAAG